MKVLINTHGNIERQINNIDTLVLSRILIQNLSNMAGIQKICIVTGASCGLGFEISKKMAAYGYEVVLACQDQAKGKQAINRIKQDSPDAKLVYMHLDLASFSSIENFATSFQKTGKKLNVLVNSETWMEASSSRKRTFTEDGVEKTFQINYVGHFLLTLLLLDILKATANFDLEARVVVVSSAELTKARKGSFLLDLDDIQLLKHGLYSSGKTAYKNSNIASFLFALELHKRLEGTKVACNVVNPGKSRNVYGHRGRFTKYISACFSPISGRSLDRACKTVVFVATSSELCHASGRCFAGSKESTIRIETNDLEVGRQLWDLSRTMVADVI